MPYTYCYLCAGKTELVSNEAETHWRCQKCGQTFYDNPKPATEVVLVTEDNLIVVAVRARDPFKGKYDLPGGFIDAGETVEQGLERELTEELSLGSANYTRPVYLTSAVDQYPWGLQTHTIISIPFTARIDSSVKLVAKDDVAKILYLSPDELKSEDFAWASQYSLVVAAIKHWSEA